MKKGLLILMLIGASAYAAGNAHHQPSIKDVMWPAVNFTLIFGFLIWKMKKPMAKSFARYAETVEEIYQMAKNNQRMAETKKAEVAEKLNSFEALKVKEKEKIDEELNLLKVEVAKEAAEQAEKLSADAVSRFEYEKQQLVKDMNREVVEVILEQAKASIAANPSLKKDITENLLAKI